MARRGADGLRPLARGGDLELTLRRPSDKPFEIPPPRDQAHGSGAGQPGPAADATQQQGTLVLRCVGSKSLQIRNNRLKAVRIEPAPPGQCQTVRAAYQYNPLSDVAPAAEPPLELWTTDVACVPRSWAWHGDLQSRFLPDGTAQHLASYRLQNCGESSIRLTLPWGLNRQDVRAVDRRRPAAARAGKGESDESILTIDLPAGEKYPTVAIDFSTRGDRLRTLGIVKPPLPQADVPVLWQHWSVVLPPGYELPEYDHDGSDRKPLGPNRSSAAWRRAGQGAFRPWRHDARAKVAGSRDEKEKTAAAAAAATTLGWMPRCPDMKRTTPRNGPSIASTWRRLASAGLAVVHRPTVRLLGGWPCC